jgi:uncharacterized protein with HEPN domain
MDRRIKAYLYDIHNAIKEVDSFLEGRTQNYFEYKKDIMLKRAIERELEIIGEAMNRIIKRDATFITRISDSKDIIGLRNQVIHAYDNLSDENIWAIIINHLPKLKKEVSILLNDH